MHRKWLILTFLIVLVSPQLVACAALTPYPVKDSGLLAEDADIVWLDNQRVLFHGYKAVEQAKSPKEFHRFIDRGLYLWDTTTGSVALYDTFDKRSDGLLLKSSLCVHDGVLSYVNRGVLISGKPGQETKTNPPKYPYWVNSHSCRYYDAKPVLVGEDHQTILLREEHGYLDLGTGPKPNYLTLRMEQPNPSISFYSTEAKKSFTLPMGWQEVGFIQVHYAPFSNRYLLSGLQYYDEQRGFLPAWPRDAPHRVWWLSPDGTLEKEEVPDMIATLQGGSPRMFPIRGGLFVISSNTRNMREPRAAGGFVVRGQAIQKTVTGMLKRAAVSPEGCRVAVVNDTYAKDRPVSERIRLQIIELCKGE